MTSKGVWVAVAGALLLSGCAGVEELEESGQPVRSQVSHEQMMHDRWSGRDYKELVAELGEPIHEMTIPRYGWPNSSALLYGLDENSGCIDAFLIVKGDDRTWVEDYFCR